MVNEISIGGDVADEILEELSYFKKPFPLEAVKAASNMQKELAPHFIEYLDYALKNVDTLDPDFMGHLYAMYLLAEYRQKEAYPYILKFYQLSEEQLDDILGDILSVGLCQVTASVFDGDLDSLIKIFEDETLYVLARLAAFNAVLILMNQKLIDKNLVIKYIEEKLKKAIQDEEVWMVTELGHTVLDYLIEQLYGLMSIAFDKGLVDLSAYDRKVFEQTINSKEESFMKSHHTLIDTAWRQMHWWAAFT